MSYPTHGSMKRQGERDHSAKVRHHHARGGDVAQDKEMITKAVHEHEAHDHPGKSKTKLKLKRGGQADHVEGHKTKARMDRKPFATGGAAKGPKSGGKKGAGHGTHVNVIVAPGGGGAGARPPMPMAPPMGGGGPPLPPRPPMAPPPGAGMTPPGPPGGAPPPMPMRPPMGGPPPGGPMMRKSGGRISVKMDDGAAGGLGRLEKIKAYGKKTLKEGQGVSADTENNGVSGDTENKSFGARGNSRGGRNR